MTAANMVAVLGGTGSGKTWRVMRHHLKRKPARLVLWDFKRDPTFDGYAEPVTAQQLVAALQRPRFAVRYQPSFNEAKRAEQWEWFCRLVHHVGNLTMWVEELARVTRPGYAAPAWSMITMTARDYSINGRRLHLDVIATSQRPANIDKDFFSNCTAIECGVLEYPRDVATMADVLRCERTTIQTLKPGQFVRRARGMAQPEIVGKPFAP